MSLLFRGIYPNWATSLRADSSARFSEDDAIRTLAAVKWSHSGSPRHEEHDLLLRRGVFAKSIHHRPEDGCDTKAAPLALPSASAPEASPPVPTVRKKASSKNRRLIEHNSKDRVPSDEDDDDDDFDERRPQSAKDPFGSYYKKAHFVARNPTPPPTGHQKRKRDLTYADGKKSVFTPSHLTKEDRRKKARKE